MSADRERTRGASWVWAAGSDAPPVGPVAPVVPGIATPGIDGARERTPRRDPEERRKRPPRGGSPGAPKTPSGGSRPGNAPSAPRAPGSPPTPGTPDEERPGEHVDIRVRRGGVSNCNAPACDAARFAVRTRPGARPIVFRGGTPLALLVARHAAEACAGGVP